MGDVVYTWDQLLEAIKVEWDQRPILYFRLLYLSLFIFLCGATDSKRKKKNESFPKKRKFLSDDISNIKGGA